MLYNATQTSKLNLTVVVTLEEYHLYHVTTLSSCLIFLYVNGVMLYTLRSKPVFRETPRYILLYNLLFADTFQLAISELMYVLASFIVYVVQYLCNIITMFGVMTANISPLTLAVMSLERYVAVCFPLRHATIVTIRGTGVAIAVVWAICSANTCIRFIMLLALDATPLDRMMTDVCTRETVFKFKIFTDYDKVFTGIVFVSVGIVIMLSYFGVMVAARSASSVKASTTKASRTVLIHLVQLFLSLSITFLPPVLTVIAASGASKVTFQRAQIALYLLFLILPRCLSALVYGLRDKIIRPILLHHLSFHLRPLMKPSAVPTIVK